MTRMEKLRDLIEEAKRRTILWAIFVAILAYLLSLTSSSIWLNIPIATLLLAVMRYLSFELEICKRVPAPNILSHLAHLLKHQLLLEDPLLCSPLVSTTWRRKIDSPIIEAAVDDFTRRIVREFVTDLWFSALSPDQSVPEQIRLLINDIFGEIAERVKRINLITLLTSDLVDLVGNHVELFRQTKSVVGVKVFETLSSDEREERLKLVLQRKHQLHPALLSPDFECKVLQRMMSGVVAILLRPQDAQCPIMRGLARELLACAVFRPIMKFASPGFINKAIEKATLSVKEKSDNKKAERALMDDSLGGKSLKGSSSFHSFSEIEAALNPLEGDLQNASKAISSSNRIPHTNSGLDVSARGKGDWAQVLDVVSQRRTRTLAPENLDNLWAKGLNYKKREVERPLKSNQALGYRTSETTKLTLEKQDTRPNVKESSIKRGISKSSQVPQLGNPAKSTTMETSTRLKDAGLPFEPSKVDKRSVSDLSSPRYEQGSLQMERSVSNTQNFENSEVKQGNSMTIHSHSAGHPLHNTMTPAPHEYQEWLMNDPHGDGLRHQRTLSSNAGLEKWQQAENTAASGLDYWDAPGMQISTDNEQLDPITGWLNDPAGASGQSLSARSAASKLNCWVVGAHLEKAASTTFAVYSIAVTDSDNNTWFVERRFRNFEQLHRNLRDLPQHNLQLPPKRFLASSLDDSFVRERCILLDKYLKDLLSIPSIAELHEVWDFLSITSKNYAFSKSPSAIKTIAVNVDDAVEDMFRQLKEVSDGIFRRASGPQLPGADWASSTATGNALKLAGSLEAPVSKNISYLERERSDQFSDDEYGGIAGAAEEDSTSLMGGWHSDSDLQIPDSMSGALAQERKVSGKTDHWSERKIARVGSDALSPEESLAGSEIFEEELAVPPEWTPPKLTVPLLNLVDSIFQLQNRGWIRRQVFWMAKQILQLGMGDAVDDWLVTQIQSLRREEVVASSIKKVQEILWPGGIFITKNKRVENIPESYGSSIKTTKQTAQKGIDQSALFESQLEASRCARVVYEILVEGGPAALVSLVGKKQYTRCAKDIYYFLQSTVFLKQLTYSVLETLLTTTFPELTNLILDIRQGSSQVVI